MKNLAEWIGTIILFVALVEFIPNPKKALMSISDVLYTNVRISNNRMVLVGPQQSKGNKEKNAPKTNQR